METIIAVAVGSMVIFVIGAKLLAARLFKKLEENDRDNDSH